MKLLGRGPTRATWMCPVLVVIGIASVWLGAIAPASAYVKGGKPWPHGVIRYFNTDKAMRSEVAAAAAAWNHSGARVHFLATSRRKARVIIYPWPKHVSPSAGCDSQIDDGCATVGFVGWIGHEHYLAISANGKWRSTGAVYLKAPSPSHLRPAALMSVVATHELGHVLGLAHSTQCATMDAAVDDFCTIPNNDEHDKYICNPLQNDDARGAVALYGGRARTFSHQLCTYVGPPIAPIGLTATLINRDPTGGYLGDIQIRFTGPPGEKLYYPGETLDTVAGYAYTVNLNTCVKPDDSSYGGTETPKEEVVGTLFPSPDQAGSYCITVENEDVFSQHSLPAHVHITVPPLPSGSGSTG